VAQATDHHVDGDVVLAALRDDQVGPALRRLDELQVHRPHALVVLLAHRLKAAPAVLDVATHPPQHPDIGVGVDEQLDVQKLA